MGQRDVSQSDHGDRLQHGRFLPRLLSTRIHLPCAVFIHLLLLLGLPLFMKAHDTLHQLHALSLNYLSMAMQFLAEKSQWG